MALAAPIAPIFPSTEASCPQTLLSLSCLIRLDLILSCNDSCKAGSGVWAGFQLHLKLNKNVTEVSCLCSLEDAFLCKET